MFLGLLDRGVGLHQRSAPAQPCLAVFDVLRRISCCEPSLNEASQLNPKEMKESFYCVCAECLPRKSSITLANFTG